MEKWNFNPLNEWFKKYKRDLPWRETATPYSVWVSEVMLQQTQVSVVIPYFQKWMKKFPTIDSLAKAPLEQIIKEWEGLGYYSRVRNLHEGAKYVMTHFQGILPQTEKELLQIKGLGAYTVGAILSFAFKQKAAAVDGNVMRVLTRLTGLNEDIAKPKTQKRVREIAGQLLPDDEPWITSEALIELGATVCTKKPKCFDCPMQKQCLAFQRGEEESLPFNSKKFKTEKLFRAVPIFIYEGECLIKKGKPGEIMCDLHEFPYLEMDSAEYTEKEAYQKMASLWVLPPLECLAELSLTSHSFTRFQASLKPLIYSSPIKFYLDNYFWMPIKELHTLPFSSGHGRICKQIIASYS